MVFDCPKVITSRGDTLFQIRPGMRNNWPSQSFAWLTLGLVFIISPLSTVIFITIMFEHCHCKNIYSHSQNRSFLSSFSMSSSADLCLGYEYFSSPIFEGQINEKRREPLSEFLPRTISSNPKLVDLK